MAPNQPNRRAGCKDPGETNLYKPDEADVFMTVRVLGEAGVYLRHRRLGALSGYLKRNRAVVPFYKKKKKDLMVWEHSSKLW